MAVSSQFVLHGILSSSPSFFLSQISNARPSPAVEVLVSTPAGLPNPMFLANMGQKPDINFDTTQIKTVLDATNTATKPTLGNLSAGTVDLSFKRVTEYSHREADAGLKHVQLRMNDAVLVCNQITAGHRTEATASCRLIAPYDGTNNPIISTGTIGTGVALSGGTPITTEHFVAGEVWINGTQINGIQDITVDFGWSLVEAGGDGELYDTFVAVQQISPVVTIRTTDMLWTSFVNSIALTALSVYFRKVNTTGRVTDVTAEHIKLAATAGLITIDDTSAGNNDTAISTIRCTLVAPSAITDPLSITSTTVAITN